MIVITAPSGNIGSQILTNILDQKAAVRIISRTPSKIPDNVRNRVEVIDGSHHDFDVAMRAFEGADAVFWLMVGDNSAPSADVSYVEFSRPGCQAMKAQGIKRVVGISALGRGWPQDAGHVTATLKLDNMIAETGVAYRALACGSLMENILRQAASIRDHGIFYWPSPADFKAPFVATRDIAAMASRLLLDSTWSGIDSIPMMGPEDISFADMAGTMSEVLGKSVTFQEISMANMKAMMESRGATKGMAQAMVNMLTAKNEGMDKLDAPARASDTPTDFRHWCEQVLKPAVLI